MILLAIWQMLILQNQWILYFNWVNLWYLSCISIKLLSKKKKISPETYNLKAFPNINHFVLLAFLLFSPTDMVKFISTPLYSASWLHSLKGKIILVSLPKSLHFANKGLLACPVVWCILVLSYLIWNSEKLSGSHLLAFISRIKLHSVYIRQTIHLNKWNRYPVHTGVRICQRM